MTAEQPYPRPVPPAMSFPAPTNGMSVAALVLGILGVAPLAVIFGHIAVRDIRKNPPQSGYGMAIAGLVLGYVVLAAWVMILLFFLVVMIGASTTSALGA
ncbi:DUF4190 domain-containing protein [Saccharopolyspora sp. NPDC049357]|uniref:DUF4190 domain-containing protein n=1 Tax=Saccharopolyspora sp. NPDC049357 TaxID=3154507 RepID=UPI003444B466